VVLIGGDPGIGKSTLLLQMLGAIAGRTPSLYVTGEESLAQVAERGHRLGLDLDRLDALADTLGRAHPRASREQASRKS
jgi:DNA repair protein RadA/Sms